MFLYLIRDCVQELNQAGEMSSLFVPVDYGLAFLYLNISNDFNSRLGLDSV